MVPLSVLASPVWLTLPPQFLQERQTAGWLFILTFIGLMILKEISTFHPQIERRVGDSLTTVVLPMGLAFLGIVAEKIF